MAGLIYVLDTVALVSAYAIVPLTKALIGASVGIIAFGFIFFGLITYAGHKLMESIEDEKEQLPKTKWDTSEQKKNEIEVTANGNMYRMYEKPSRDIDLGKMNNGYISTDTLNKM